MGTGFNMAWGVSCIPSPIQGDPTGIENFEELKKRTRGDGSLRASDDATKALALRLAHLNAKTVEEYKEIKRTIEAYVPLSERQIQKIELTKLLEAKV